MTCPTGISSVAANAGTASHNNNIKMNNAFFIAVASFRI
jgi:hypothetical protein